MATRDRERTRARILESAIREFARMGYAGARIDEIAATAGVNKRMIYHYFQSKENLYGEVLHRCLADQGPRGEPVQLVDALDDEFDPRVLRLMTWEALTGDSDNIVAQSDRGFAWRRLLAAVVRDQQTGVIRSDLDPQQLTLALLSVRMFPRIFSQYTRMILDEGPRSPDFDAGLDDFFRALLDALRPDSYAREHKPRVRMKPVSRLARSAH